MTYVLYADGHRPPDKYPRSHVVVFPEAPQAKVWLDQMEYRLPEGFTVRSAQMDQIRNAAETNWQLDDDHANWIRRFKWGTWDEVHEQPKPDEPTSTAAAPRSKREHNAQRPDGFVTITELCAGSDVLPSDARAILRAHMEKPSFGWAFAPKQVAVIKKLCGIK